MSDEDQKRREKEPPADLDRTDVKPLTEEQLAEIYDQAKEFLTYGTIYPEGTGLDNNGILWLLDERRRMRVALEKADQWILNNPRVTSWGAVDPISEKERGDVRAAIAEALK